MEMGVDGVRIANEYWVETLESDKYAAQYYQRGKGAEITYIEICESETGKKVIIESASSQAIYGGYVTYQELYEEDSLQEWDIAMDMSGELVEKSLDEETGIGVSLYTHLYRIADESYNDGNPHWTYEDHYYVIYGYEDCAYLVGIDFDTEWTIEEVREVLDLIQVQKAEGLNLE